MPTMPAESLQSAQPKPPSASRLRATYWLCNAIEMWERLAYYMLRPVAAIYIMQATEPGGLRLTAEHKGWIYMWWAVFQSFFPMFTGGLADRYGYRRTLTLALSLNLLGYLLMAFLHSYAGFFGGVLVLAVGTAFFKPALQGTLAHSLTKGTSSLGWGIFYWIVNVGSFFGHMISPLLLGQPHTAGGWRNLFLACAACTVINLLMLLTFPDVPSGASKTETPLQVLARTLRNIAEPRLVAWLLIMSGFWMMMYQLWDLQPNFIEDWVDSSMVAAHAPFASWRELGPEGVVRVPQQVLISLNALLIVALVVPVSWLVRRMRTLSAMLLGMLGATGGVLVAGLTDSGWWLLGGIVLFSLGEMLTGPKKSEYLGLIAPPGKKGLYLGYVNIPVGLGVGLGSYLAGLLYGRVGEKATLALRYLVEHANLSGGRSWDGSVSTLESVAGLSRTEAFGRLQEVLHLTSPQATQLLWETYHPQYWTWLPFAAVGVLSALALAVFARMARRWQDMNA